MGRIFCLDCSRRELEWCKYFCRAREVREARCHNHTYTECTICGHLHMDSSKDVVDKCVFCLQMHCCHRTDGCMAQCSERIKCEKRRAESDKLYYEYENVVGLVLKEYNESKYKYKCKSRKYTPRQPMGTPNRRKDKRANVKSKRKFQRRYQMSLHY